MSVIAELRVSADEFELGRVLELEDEELIELETMIPIGQKAIPFFRVHEQVRDVFESRVRNHPSVNRVQEIDRFNGERLYELDWDASSDHFFNAISETEAQLMSARGGRTSGSSRSDFPTTTTSHGSTTCVRTPASTSRSSGYTTR